MKADEIAQDVEGHLQTILDECDRELALLDELERVLAIRRNEVEQEMESVGRSLARGQEFMRVYGSRCVSEVRESSFFYETNDD